MPGITPFLWFDNQAEAAANFHVSVFRNSKIKQKTYYTGDEPIDHKRDRLGVVPAKWAEWSGDSAGLRRVMQALMPMKKLNIAKLQEAYDG